VHQVYGNCHHLLLVGLGDSVGLGAETVQIRLVSEELHLDEKMMDDYHLKVQIMLVGYLQEGLCELDVYGKQPGDDV
jgi:hypothetical protein